MIGKRLVPTSHLGGLEGGEGSGPCSLGKSDSNGAAEMPPAALKEGHRDDQAAERVGQSPATIDPRRPTGSARTAERQRKTSRTGN